MESFVDLGTVLLRFYIIVGIMAIGFAWMFRGPEGAKVAARWVFWQPVVLLLKWSWTATKKVVRWMMGR